MDNENKDKLQPDNETPETAAPRGGIEGRWRTAQTGSASGEDELLQAEPAADEPETAAADEEDLGDVVIPSDLEPRPEKKKHARKKKKKMLPLIITAGIFVVLFLGYAAMQWLIPAREKADDSPKMVYTPLITYTADQITDIDFAYRDGYAYTLNLTRYVNEAGYNVTAYSVAGKGEFTYDQEKFSRMVAQIAEISSGTTANENAVDLSIYGLDEPKVIVTYHIFDENGMSTVGKTLKIGNAAPIGSGHYGMVEGDDNVYVIGFAEADYLVSTDYDYRDLTLLTINDYINDIQSVSIHRGEDDDLIVARATTEEKHALEYATTYRIYEPALVNCNTYYIEQKMLQYMTVFYAEAAIEDYPRDLAQYGLSEADDPMEIVIETVDGEKTKFTLSKTILDDGKVYGKVSGQTTIFTFDPALFSFTDVTYSDLLDMTIWLYEFKDVDHIDLMLDGEAHTLYVDRASDGTITTRLDELTIREDDARQLYARMLQIYLDDIVRKDDKAGEVQYSIFIHGVDGKIRSLELAAINDRRFIVILDGVEQEYYVRYDTIKWIMKGVSDLYEGLHLTYTI